MIDYYCEMHGCKFIPLVSSIFVRARRCSYKCAPVYFDHFIEMSGIPVDPDGKPGLLNYEINLSLSQNPTSPKSSCETTEQATLTSES